MRLVTIVLLVAIAGGCLIKPSAPASQDASTDTQTVPSCVGVPFTDSTEMIPPFNQGDYGPAEREDQLEIWLYNNIAPSGFLQIYVARRTSPTGPYAAPQVRFPRPGFH